MNALKTPEDVKGLIAAGRKLLLAGDERLLAQLPSGDWIGGTIPYFMSEQGGLMTQDRIQVVELPAEVTSVRIKSYGPGELSKIPAEYGTGFSAVIVPASSDAHQRFARESFHWDRLFDRPLVGWVAGVKLADVGKVKPKVFDGRKGEVSDSRAVVAHFDLAEGRHASPNIINLFKPGSGDDITFPETGFETRGCEINGKQRNFVEYVNEKQIDTKLPLVADYSGAMINVSFQAVDEKAGKVAFYAPVFPRVKYRVAAPVGDYEKEFSQELKTHDASNAAFSCNCILNYLYASLEGKHTGHLLGPMTFGEISYILLNQTLVYLTLQRDA